MATTSALDTSTNTNTNTTTPPPPPTNLYEYIASYDFSSDLEFRKGLGAILGHAEMPASDSELVKEDDKVVLQAKCFYISRKKNVSPPIDAASFRNWLVENNKTAAAASSSSSHAQQQSEQQQQQQQESEQTLPPSSDATSGKDAEPAYPSSFSQIVELITTGQPIPGIEEIPDTVLSGHDKPSKAERRRKPWEKAEEESSS